MKLSKKTLAVLAVMLLAGAYLYDSLKNRVPFEERKPAVNDSAPAISLADLSGKMVSLEEMKGKVVLINFWATWCPPCKDEMPGFQRVLDAFEGDFAVIAIAIDDVSPSLVRELGIAFPVVRTNPRVIKDYGDISDVPVSFLVGRDGRIIKKVRKTYREEDLRRDVEKALKGKA